MKSNKSKKHECKAELLFDFGLQPVSNRFLMANSTQSPPSFPLQLYINTDSGLIYLAKPFPLEEIKPQFDWLTCYEPEDHLDDLVGKLIKLPGITPNSLFGAYSFKDDSTLRRLEGLGFKKNWRIDPLHDLDVLDRCANVETYQSVFTPEKARNICGNHGAADVLIVRHVLEHSYDLQLFIRAIRGLVKTGGYIVWEIPDCERALSVGDSTTVWEEHIFYFTSFTFKRLLIESGFSIVHYETVPYPLENSIIAIVKETPDGDASVVADLQLVNQEIVRAKKFATLLEMRKFEIRKTLKVLKDTVGPIAIFGAGHLSVAFISLMNVADLITCVVDDNPNKKGMEMPVGGLKIVGSEELTYGHIKVCLLGLNPQNHAKVRANHKSFTSEGGIFLSIFPDSSLGLDWVK
jgi:hypothetical protein